MGRCDLSDFEWSLIEPVLPNKSRGVPRVDDRHVLNGIFWVMRSDAPWADLPERNGPHTTCYNHFHRWTEVCVWDRIMDAITEASDGNVQMIDGTSARVHHSAATLKKPPRSLSRKKSNYSDSGLISIKCCYLDRLKPHSAYSSHIAFLTGRDQNRVAQMPLDGFCATLYTSKQPVCHRCPQQRLPC